MSPSVLQAYGLGAQGAAVKPFGTGLIHHTWKITAGNKEYILQKINQQVFTEPETIAANYRMLAAYLQEHYPDYTFVAPVASVAGPDLIYEKGDGWYRLAPFVAGSHSKDVVATAAEAFEAAKQFGRFTRLLAALNATALKITLPSFHDLSLRYQQFVQAVQNGNTKRIGAATKEIDAALSHKAIVDTYERIKTNPAFKLRVTHHDTKISNVLFDAENRGICVIDLDTVMPGYFISDVGDMMRTYLSPVTEEEMDFSKIVVREEVYKALVEGYYAEMKEELTAEEKNHFFFAGLFMIYMQALRFLTDHLNNDAYYGARYEGHNLVRAGNQLELLQKLLNKKTELEGYL